MGEKCTEISNIAALFFQTEIACPSSVVPLRKGHNFVHAQEDSNLKEDNEDPTIYDASADPETLDACAFLKHSYNRQLNHDVTLYTPGTTIP